MGFPQYDGREDYGIVHHAHRSFWHTGSLSSYPCFVGSNILGTPPAKKPKTTTQGPLRKILLLFFNSFIPEIDCTKAVDDINAILVTFPSGIRAQVMTHMYQAYGIEMMCIPTPMEIG
jgi:hypothetical protein